MCTCIPISASHSARFAGRLAGLHDLGQRHGAARPRGVHEDRPAVPRARRQVVAHALRCCWTAVVVDKPTRQDEPKRKESVAERGTRVVLFRRPKYSGVCPRLVYTFRCTYCLTRCGACSG